MKPYFSTILLTWIILAPSYGQVNPTWVTGKIINPLQSSVLINDSLVSLSEAGEFKFALKLTKPSYFKLKHQGQEAELFIQPSETLVINFKASDFPDKLTFKGASSAINYFLLQLAPQNQRVNNYLNNKWVKLFSKPEKEFFYTIDSLKGLFLNPLNKLVKTNKSVNQWFVNDTRHDILFTFDRFLLMYPQSHTRFTGEQVTSTENIDRYLNKINLDDSGLLEANKYKNFGQQWLDAKIDQAYKNKNQQSPIDNQWLNKSFTVIRDQFKNQEVQAFWMYHYLYNHIDNHGVKNTESYLKQFNAASQNKEFKDKVNALYNQELKNRKIPLVKTYKRVNGVELDAFIFLPKDLRANEKRPAMVYFHGGSWSEGKPDWHFGYSEEGFVNVAVEYRTSLRHGVLPFQEVSDAKSAIRWLRQHADEFHIDVNKIIAQGNSAGGHLILCAAMTDTLDESAENIKISSKPNALILNSAVFDLSGWNHFDHQGRLKANVMDISPTHLIKGKLPPMLVFHGTKDNSVPFSTAKAFSEKMRNAGNMVDFYPIENANHDIWFNPIYQKESKKIKLDFLQKIDFLD